MPAEHYLNFIPHSTNDSHETLRNWMDQWGLSAEQPRSGATEKLERQTVTVKTKEDTMDT